MLSLNASLPMILNRALDGVMPAYRQLFAQYDLTEQQWRILRALWEVEDLRAAELAEQTLLPKPSLVGILDRLEARGLVERRRSNKDRRAVSIASTAKGRTLAKEVLPQAQAIHDFIRAVLPEEDWDALEHALNTLADRMKATTFAEIAAE